MATIESYIETARDTVVFSIFKSDWKAFEKIEGDFLDHSFSFNFEDETQAITLMNILV